MNNRQVYEEMKAQKMSQIELALRMGVTRQTVHNYLTSRNDIASEKYKLLLDVLGYEIRKKV